MTLRQLAGLQVSRERPEVTNDLMQYVDWIKQSALPVWATAGFDEAHSRFRERLDWNGAPVDIPHRAMVQARQTFVYAHAGNAGWYANGGELADRAMRNLRDNYCTESATEASFAFSINADGSVASDKRDSYTHAFVLFAIASLYRVSGDAALLSLAEKTNRFTKAHLTEPQFGGVFDEIPNTSKGKRQNPLMHLLEAYLALERVAPDRGFLHDAGAIVQLFKKHLHSANLGVLHEYFNHDWSLSTSASLAPVFEPGHHFEWVWLLREYELLSGEVTSAVADSLYETGATYGIAPNGLVYDEVRDDFTIAKPSHRLWPHTEGIKAGLAQHHRYAGDSLVFASSMAHELMEKFLDVPFKGGWVDQLHPDGSPSVSYVPASSLYHLVFAAAEIAKLGPANDTQSSRTIKA